MIILIINQKKNNLKVYLIIKTKTLCKVIKVTIYFSNNEHSNIVEGIE